MVPCFLENERPKKRSQYLMPLAAHRYRFEDRKSSEVMANGNYDLVGELGHGDRVGFWSSGRFKVEATNWFLVMKNERTKKEKGKEGRE